MSLKKTALILEGGGMRGIFSAGVVDFFLEKDLHFPYVIGTSMGACNGASYVSKQHERSLRIPMNYLDDWRYLSFRNLITEGNLFGMGFIFNEVPYKLDPFDFDTFERSKQQFITVATSCKTGEPAYFSKNDLDRMTVLKSFEASTSLPFLSTMKEIDGELYLDGGIADSIPIKKALKDGYEKLVVVLTRPEDYEKSTSAMTKLLAPSYYWKYPALAQQIVRRAEDYNQTLDYVKDLEEAGKVFVIRPEEAIVMPRIGKDKNLLKKAYDVGYERTKKVYEELEDFLNE